jgi:hypothetical protein
MPGSWPLHFFWLSKDSCSFFLNSCYNNPAGFFGGEGAGLEFELRASCLIVR